MVDRLARMSRPCVATHGCGDSRGTDAWFHPHAPARGLSIASQPALDGMLNERSWVPGLGWVAAGAYRTVVAMLVARASPLLNTLIGSKCVKPTRRPLSTVQVGTTAVRGEPPNTPKHHSFARALFDRSAVTSRLTARRLTAVASNTYDGLTESLTLPGTHARRLEEIRNLLRRVGRGCWGQVELPSMASLG